MDKYKDIHSSVSSKKENINDLETLELFRQEFLGKKVEVLCKGKGKKEGQIRGTTKWMQVVNFKQEKNKRIKTNVRIIKATDNSLLGDPA